MSFLSSLFGGLGSMLGGAGSSIMGGLGSLGGGLGSLGKGVMGLFGGGGGGSNTMPNISKVAGGMMGGGGGGAISPAVSGVTGGGMFPQTQPEKPKSFLDNLFPGGSAQGIAGLAIPAIGNMFGPKSPSIPNFGNLSSVQALQNFQPGKSVSPEYQKMLQGNTDRLRDKRVQDLQAVYRSSRPGTDYLTDTNYQRDLAEIERQVQSQMSSDLAGAESTFSQQEQSRLSEIAQMDIYSIMAQTGLDAQEANDFKEMFSNVGNMLLTNATKKPSSMNDLMSLFGGA